MPTNMPMINAESMNHFFNIVMLKNLSTFVVIKWNDSLTNRNVPYLNIDSQGRVLTALTNKKLFAYCRHAGQLRGEIKFSDLKSLRRW